MPALPNDTRVYLLGADDVIDPRHFRPLDIAEPDDILFGCFFHDDDERAALLSSLRETALVKEEGHPGSLVLQVAREMEDCRLRGDATGMLVAAIRWWAGVKRQGYHAYKLRVGVDRYRCSCIIAFRERTPAELKNAIAPAVDALEEAKERVAGFFQYPFD